MEIYWKSINELMKIRDVVLETSVKIQTYDIIMKVILSNIKKIFKILIFLLEKSCLHMQ